MPSCPYCHQAVEDQAIACPHCHCQLKAHGHPGIPLHRATDQAYLCQTCRYEADDTCTFPQRPYARTCTLYRDQAAAPSNSNPYAPYPLWRRRLWVWVALVALFALALVLAL